MVIAAARTARPAICPPTRRESRGNCADTSATRMGRADCAGVGSGESCGKATPGLLAGPGRAGNDADGSTPCGRGAVERVPGGSKKAGGSVPPTPAGVAVLPAEDVAGAGVGVVGVFTETLSHAAAGAAASGDVPVAVRVILLGAAFCGTGTLACNSVGWAAARVTRQVAVPGVWQTVKTGESLAGCVVRATVAFPLVVPTNQTQTA
jgi:hypothetical protein